MSIKKATDKDINEIAEKLGIQLTPTTLNSFKKLMEPAWQAYEDVAAAEVPAPTIKYSRVDTHQPAKEDNPCNAWYYKTNITGASHGKLVGKTVAIKDNTCVAEVPMMNGSTTFGDYVPELDATVVTWILDAGGCIKGKAHCEYLCVSGGSYTNSTGPVLNPHKLTHSAGGSSSGSAVLVACGAVDMATGGDQGGSIRIPAAWCGICGMKPTYGLIPYTGAMPIERNLDHVGPLTKTVADNALFLEVMAGRDGLDSRQPSHIKPERYTESLGKDIKGMKIGLLKQGFGTSVSEPVVDEAVLEAAEHLKKLGAEIIDIDCPMHITGTAVWSVIAQEGMYDLMFKDNGFGTNDSSYCITSLMQANSNWKNHTNDLSEVIKLFLLTAEYAKQTFSGGNYSPGAR